MDKEVNSGLEVGGTIDTFYESNNEFDEEDGRYKEFYACAVMIDKIIKNDSDVDLMPNSLVEISTENQPTVITLLDGSIVWHEGQCQNRRFYQEDVRQIWTLTMSY